MAVILGVFMALTCKLVGSEIYTLLVLIGYGVYVSGKILSLAAKANRDPFLKGESGVVRIDEWGKR